MNVSTLKRPRKNDLLGLSLEKYALVNNGQPPVFADQFIADNVPTNMLFADYSYARPLTKARMRKYDACDADGNYLVKWDVAKAGMLYVSMRDNDGTFALIDGQGRMYLALRDKVETVPARVYMDLTIKQEAELYLAFNRDRVITTPLDDFHARITAMEPKALEIQSVLESLNIRLVNGHGAHAGATLRSVNAVEYVYTQWGADSLRYVMRTLLEAWHAEDSSLTSDLIIGLATFFARVPKMEQQSGNKFHHNELVSRLASKVPNYMKSKAKVQNEARPGMSHGQAMGRAILVLYDLGRRLKLGDWPEKDMNTLPIKAGMQERTRKAVNTRAARKKSRSQSTDN